MKVTTNTVLRERARGGGIILRHPRWAEFEEWAALRRANQTYLEPWEPEWTEVHMSRNSYKSKLARFKKLLGNDVSYPFHIFRVNDGRLIGACTVLNVQRHVAQSCEVGYWIGEDYARQGFARAAVRAVTRFCFDDLGLHRVEAAVQTRNTRSIRLLEALDFKHEGTARGRLKIKGVWTDHDIYSRLSSDG